MILRQQKRQVPFLERGERILVTHNSNHITTRASLTDIILVPLQCTIVFAVKWNALCPREAKYFLLSVLLFSRKRHFFELEKKKNRR